MAHPESTVERNPFGLRLFRRASSPRHGSEVRSGLPNLVESRAPNCESVKLAWGSFLRVPHFFVVKGNQQSQVKARPTLPCYNFNPEPPPRMQRVSQDSHNGWVGSVSLFEDPPKCPWLRPSVWFSFTLPPIDTEPDVRQSLKAKGLSRFHDN